MAATQSERGGQLFWIALFLECADLSALSVQGGLTPCAFGNFSKTFAATGRDRQKR